MNNPNPDYHRGAAADPDDDFDYERFMDHVFDAVALRGTQIRSWFEAKGLVDVRVRPLPLRELNSWEVLMVRGETDECRTGDDLQALVMRLASEMGYHVEPHEFLHVVWSDRIGTHFRLRPLPV
jgi:hypothetical protein